MKNYDVELIKVYSISLIIASIIMSPIMYIKYIELYNTPPEYLKSTNGAIYQVCDNGDFYNWEELKGEKYKEIDSLYFKCL